MKSPANAGLLHFFPCAFSFFDKSGKLFLLINKKYSSRNTATLPLESRGGFSTDRQQAGDHPPESQNTVSRNSLIGINDPA
ncbi:hypothetical protein ACT4UI_26200 [Pseudomonas aeruginosa]|uniref:hypothetical protein n=1 Tax=Pseudomonas aeruginosa TaxID=287 RepID=UPI0012985D9F|nr:hypothetical protein [Pseudomonas aeruginosa]HEJ5336759.1 hypothetical protein [Pseudomonas aeruginosa]